MAARTKGGEGIADISEIAIDNLAPPISAPADYLILFHIFFTIITHTNFVLYGFAPVALLPRKLVALALA